MTSRPRTGAGRRSHPGKEPHRLGQCSGNGPEGRSRLLLCVPVFETRTDRLHCGLPEPAFVLRRPLVEAAERAVAEGFPPRPGVSVLGPFDWWLALCWNHNAGKPRPGEVLRPRRMVVVGIDFRRDLVRSSFPKLMPDHRLVRSASCPRPACLGVSAMTVDDEDPREALAEQRIDDVREDCDQGGLQERDVELPGDAGLYGRATRGSSSIRSSRSCAASARRRPNSIAFWRPSSLPPMLARLRRRRPSATALGGSWSNAITRSCAPCWGVIGVSSKTSPATASSPRSTGPHAA